MIIEVTMPQLGETVAEGTVTRWLRQVGDVISDQEPLLEISTDKVDTEVPAPGSGRLQQILIEEDATVAVGTVLAIIAAESHTSAGPAADSTGPSGAAEPDPPAVAAVPTGTAPALQSATGRAPHRRHIHSPLIRRLAAEAGIATVSLTGTGPGGRVTRQDVAHAARQIEGSVTESVSASAPRPSAVASTPSAVPMTGIRAVIADRMMQSLQTTAQLTTVVEVDLTRVIALRRAAAGSLHDRLGVRLTLTAFFAKAALEGLRAMPVLNSAIGPDGRSVIRHPAQHLGIAVDTDRGLMVPVLRDAGDLSLLGLSRRIEEIANRARTGTITPDELVGGTFTLTNTGSRGALFDTPILVPGQVGILGTGAVVERPAVVRQADGERVIAIRSIAYLALTYDHRLVDGADAARYLTGVKNRLEAGQFEPELG